MNKYYLYQIISDGDETTEERELRIRAQLYETVDEGNVSLFQLVATILADNLEESFLISNTTRNGVNRLNPMAHSMSVGDIVRDEWGKFWLCKSVGFELLAGELEFKLPHYTTTNYLDYEIVNSGNSDGWVLTKPNGKLWERNLGNFSTLESAKKFATLHFMIARPDVFHHSLVYRMSGSGGAYHEYFLFRDAVNRAGLQMPDEVSHTEDTNCLIAFNGEKL